MPDGSTKKFGIIITRDNTFSNGMNQNAIFLYELIKHLGYYCDLLSYDEKHTEIFYNRISVQNISSDFSKFDPTRYTGIITVSTSLDRPIYDKCKEHNVHVIGYICSNTLCMAIEETVTAHSRTTVLVHSESPITKAWVLDAFPFMKTHIELLRGVKAQFVPHVWNSEIVEYYCKHLENKDPKLLVYNPKLHTNKKLTLVISEPNCNFVKSCVVQLMAAEKLNSINPDLIDEVYIFSYQTESKSLNTLVDKLNVGKKVRKFSRLNVCEILLYFNSLKSVPVFACHQIYTPLNYSYYELMYYGFPFVHNSPLLMEYGHFYNDLDIDLCAVQIYKAYKAHDDGFELSKNKNRAFLETIDPTHTRCAERWKNIFDELRP